MLGPCFLPAAYADVPHVAVGFGFTGRQRQYNHSAIIYRCEDRTLRAIDFSLEGDITSDSPEQKLQRFAWAVPQLHERQLRQVAAYCESVGKQRSRFTYSFAFNSLVQLADSSDGFVIEGGTEGFTCATFVLAIFQRLRLPLIDLRGWYNEPEDEPWQESTLSLLRGLQARLGLSDQSLAARAAEIPCLRFPPHAVIGACRAGVHPTTCGRARHAGNEVAGWLDELHRMIAT